MSPGVGVVGGEFESLILGRKLDGSAGAPVHFGAAFFGEGVDPANHGGNLITAEVGMREHGNFTPDCSDVNWLLSGWIATEAPSGENGGISVGTSSGQSNRLSG